MFPCDLGATSDSAINCICQRFNVLQWNPEMWTLAGPTSSVLIIEVSFIQGLELFVISMSI